MKGNESGKKNKVTIIFGRQFSQVDREGQEFLKIYKSYKRRVKNANA